MDAEPSDDELREFIAAMLSNLDRQLREPEVIEESLREHREMWEKIYRASQELERETPEA